MSVSSSIKVLYNPCCIIYSRFWPSSCSSAPSSLCCTTSESCSFWSVISRGSWPPWWVRHQRNHWTPPETSSLVRYDVMLLWWRNGTVIWCMLTTFYANSKDFYRSSKFFYLMSSEILVGVLKNFNFISIKSDKFIYIKHVLFFRRHNL